MKTSTLALVLTLIFASSITEKPVCTEKQTEPPDTNICSIFDCDDSDGSATIKNK